MEDFAAKENKIIKEKSMYILNLDTPRIIIISSVVIGLVIISVLIGMNITKQEKDSDNFVHENTAIMENLVADNTEKSHPSETSAIEQSLNNESSVKTTDNDNTLITAENNTIKPKEQTLPLAVNNSVKDQTNKTSSDMLSHENIESIIPPTAASSSSVTKKVGRKSIKKNTDKVKENKTKKNVIEVSSNDKSIKSHNIQKDYYCIQVAAFDKKNKAVTEIKNLENNKYNAYIDNAKINGKTFYRVMIGPIDSKKKAADLLEEISSYNRYGESYLIKK